MKDAFQLVVWIVGLILLLMWTLVPFTDLLLAIPYRQVMEVMIPYTTFISLCVTGAFLISLVALKVAKKSNKPN